MTKVYIIVEGQTEEKFVKGILYNYFESKNIYLQPIIYTTKRMASGNKYKGGAINFDKLKNEIFKISDKNCLITTMIDYYGIDEDFPGYKESLKLNDYLDKAECIENKMFEINKNNFIPYIQMHEFEALLFSDLDKFSLIGDKKQLENLKKDIINFKNPEEINNSKTTAPSKRINKFYENYSKTTDGITILTEIRIEKIKSKCKHFNDWLNKIISKIQY